MIFDLAVIGGGPAGLIAAREAAEKALEVVVFEEHSEIGEPERCAGLLSLAGLQKISIPQLGSYVQNVLRGAVFYIHRRRYLIDTQRPVAAVVNRKLFDQELAKQAEKAGARILRGARVKDVEKIGDALILRTRGEEIRASWVIDAEGAGAALLRKFLRKGTESAKWIPIIQLMIEGHELDERYAHIYFKRYLPDFFAYLIPINRDLGKLGVASRCPDLRKRLLRFLREEFPHVKILKQIRYVIYTGSPIIDLDLSKHFIPVGDAAGHVKATTGGGVIMGGLYSRNVAAAISEMVNRGDPAPYLENAFKVVEELRRIAFLRSIMREIPQIFYAPILASACSKPLKALLAAWWDMDFQVSSLFSGSLKRSFGLYCSSRGFSQNEQ